MFNNDPFYHETIRRHIVNFGNLFNEISINRYDDTNTVIDTIAVPLAYAPKEKFITRLEQESSIDTEGTKVQMTLPRLGFHMTGLDYDSERKLNTLTKRVICDPDNPEDGALWEYQRTPWNLQFELYAFTKNYDDMLQIAEQIFPFFAPHYVTRIEDNRDFPGEYSDIPIIMNGVTPDEEYEDAGNWDTRRAIVWTFSFTDKAWLYGRTNQQGLIKEVEIPITDQNDCSDLETTTVTPDPPDAGPSDDFGFSITIDNGVDPC